MALKRAAFSVTIAADGRTGAGSDDVHLNIPSSPTRPCYLEGVAVDDTAAAGHLNSLTLFEGDLDATDLTTVTEGVQLFTVDDSTGNLRVGTFDIAGESDSGSLPLIKPRTADLVVDETGATLATTYARIPIRSPYLICRLTGGATGDVFTVYVYYETAGDWRF